MTKILITLFMIWLLVRLFRSPSTPGQKRNSSTAKRTSSRTETPPEGTTTIARIGKPKEKIVDASDAEIAHYEEVKDNDASLR